MDANGLAILLSVSVVVNIGLVAYCFRKTPGVSKEAKAIQKLIRRFETQRGIVLQIEAVDSDNVFIRNPSTNR